MKNIIWGGALFLCAVVSVVVTKTATATAEVPADARRAIQAANDAWIPAIERQDPKAVSEAYADDGVFVTPGGETVVGPSGVETLMRGRFAASHVVDGKIAQDGIRMEGTLIYEWGHADLQVVGRDGTKTASHGRYLTVWKRGAGGKWRIWRNLSLVD